MSGSSNDRATVYDDNYEDDSHHDTGRQARGPLKRRVNRACDLCRRRKVRCEGQTLDQSCNLCRAHNATCTFNEEAQKRGPPKGYVEALEARVRQMEAMLQSLSAGDPGPHGAASNGAASDGAASKGEGSEQRDRTSSTTRPAPSPFELASNQANCQDDTELVRSRVESLMTEDGRTLGEASPLTLTTMIDRYRSAPIGSSWQAMTMSSGPWHESWFERLEYAEREHRALGRYALPASDLVASLVDIYFECHHPVMPILHEPSFRRDLATGVAETSMEFRRVVFAVLALASKHSDDPRVLGSFGWVDSEHAQLEPPPVAARGWAFAVAVWASGMNYFGAITLQDLQASTLHFAWLQTMLSSAWAWSWVAFLIRRAQDVGMHRRVNSRWNKSLIEDELRKRTFWTLVVFDRHLASILGRSVAIGLDDMDLGLPAELSDAELETLGAMNLPFPRTLPPRPSTAPPTDIAAYRCMIHLSAIASIALASIYPTLRKGGPAAEEDEATIQKRNVAELDTLLNRFLEDLPAHLRWDPRQPNERWALQSGIILCMYYSVQILVHRSFLRPDRAAMVAFPSLSICMNAARSLAHVLDNLRERHLIQRACITVTGNSFTAALVLMINSYGINKVPELSDSATSDVYKCLAALEAITPVVELADRMILSLKACLELLPNASTASALHSLKRERDNELSPQTAESSRASSPVAMTQSPPSGPPPAGAMNDEAHVAAESVPAKKRSRESGRKSRGGEGRSSRRGPPKLPMRTSELGAPDFAGDPTFRGGDPSIQASQDAFARLTGMSLEQAQAAPTWQGAMPPQHTYAQPAPVSLPRAGHWQLPPPPTFPQSAARSAGPFSFGDFDVTNAILPTPRPFNLQQPPVGFNRQPHPSSIPMPEQRQGAPMLPTMSNGGPITSPSLDPSLFGTAAIDWTMQDPFAAFDWQL